MTAPSFQEVNEEVQGLESDQFDYLKEVVKNDLFVLCKGVLNYQQVNRHTHGEFCRFIETPPLGKKRTLSLMPRAHLKSTILTIGDSIRLAIRDPNDTRILIAGETSTNAEKFLAEIKGHFEKNVILRSMFQDLIPTRFAGPGVTWSSSNATLVRTTAHRESTWSTVGQGGAIVGGHFNRIKGDDLIGLEAKKSPAVMLAAIKWVENIDSLLINQHIDRIDFVGTRWAIKDLYERIMRLYGDQLAVFTREAIEDGIIIFPEMHTIEEYARMQAETPDIWYSQYCNNPSNADQLDFPQGAIRNYHFDLDNNVVLELGNGETRVWAVNELDRCLHCDPNSGSKTAEDPAAIVVTGVSPDNEIVVLHSESKRYTPSGLVDRVYELHKRWKPRATGIEEAGQQTTKFYFEQKAELDQYFVHTVPIKPKNRDKEDKIRKAIEPILRSKRLYCLPTQTELRRQVDQFFSKPIDELDALSFGTEPGMWRKPYREEDQEKKKSNLKLLVARRNSRTGY
jgi:hypothetical protein